MLVEVFTQPGCGPCIATKNHLNKLGVEFDEYDAREHLDTLGALGAKEAPVVVVFDEETDDQIAWTGYRPDRLNQLKN